MEALSNSLLAEGLQGQAPRDVPLAEQLSNINFHDDSGDRSPCQYNISEMSETTTINDDQMATHNTNPRQLNRLGRFSGIIPLRRLKLEHNQLRAKQ